MTVDSARVAQGSARGQGGFTLMEMLLVVAISGIIAVPIFAWMVTAFRTEEVVQRTSKATNATNQLTRFFPRDMSSASVVTVGGANCAGAAPGDFVAVSLLNHDLSRLVAYVGTDAAGRGQLVRRTCTPAGPVIEETVIVENVGLPLNANLAATPQSIPSRPLDQSGRVDLTVTPSRGAPLTVTGSRRTGSDT